MRAGGTGRPALAAVLMVVSLAAVAGTVALIQAMQGSPQAQPLDVYTLGGLVVGGAYAVVGWLIASRRPDNSIGWIYLALAVSQAGSAFASAYAQYGLAVAPGSLPLADLASWLAVWVWAPGFTLLTTLSVLLFPDGRPPGPRWRPIVWLSYLIMALLAIPVAIATWPHRGTDLLSGAAFPDMRLAEGLQTVGILLIPVVGVISIAGMVVRYRRGGSTERQQLKWFTFAAIFEITFVVSTGFLSYPTALAFVTAILIGPLIPAAAAIAILRYRLYEIDRIISRTIAYAVVTGVLAATFAATIILLQSVLARFTGGQTVAVAASTLAVFALFQPVLRRVRRIVDRRFDRARYDAERTALAFSERLRDEVDMATVTTDLVTTVTASVRPVAVGFWLRGSGR